MKHLDNYKTVAERLQAFDEDHENASITCEYKIDKEWNNSLTDKTCNAFFCSSNYCP